MKKSDLFFHEFVCMPCCLFWSIIDLPCCISSYYTTWRSELHKRMWSLLKQFGFKKTSQVESWGMTESASLILLPWASLIWKLSIAPSIFLLDQRKVLYVWNRNKSQRLWIVSPPSDVQGITELDRTAFKRQASSQSLKRGKKYSINCCDALKGSTAAPGLKHVIERSEDEEGRLFLLDPYKLFTTDAFEEEELSILKQQCQSTDIEI